MADVDSAPDPLSPSDAEVRQGIELLYFAHRDFTAEPDAILAQYGFGRAHHRVVHFVGRHPRIPVGELLGILRITKQSLGRVLGALVRQGFVVERPGDRDRRQRLLELTGAGKALEEQLSAPQRTRIAAAYQKAGGTAVEGFRRVLLRVVADAADRRRFEPDPPADEI